MVLLLYPQSFQDAFGAEMTAVFADRAAEYREKGLLSLLRFMHTEITGLLIGSLRERMVPDSLAPVVGGTVAAVALHSFLYQALLGLYGR